MNELKLRSEDLDWREIEGEVIALEGRSALYMSVNPAGALLWQALAGGASESDLAALLAETYEIDGESAAADARRFVAQLEEQGLIEPR